MIKAILFAIIFLPLSVCVVQVNPQHITADQQLQGAGEDSVHRLPVVGPTGTRKVAGATWYNTVDKKLHWLSDPTHEETYIPALTEAQQDALFPIDGFVDYNTDRQRPSFWSQTFFQWFGWGEVPLSYFTPTDGATVALVRGTVNIINPSSGLSSLTLSFPTGLTVSDFLEIKFTQGIASLSYSGVVPADGIPSASAGLYTKYFWKSSAWY